MSMFDVAGTAFKAVLRVVRTMDEVPRELETLAHHLSTIQILLSVLDSIRVGSFPPETLTASLSALPFTLSTAESIATRLEQALLVYKGSDKRGHRLKLALLKREEMERVSTKLELEVEKLKLLLQVLNLQFHIQGYERIGNDLANLRKGYWGKNVAYQQAGGMHANGEQSQSSTLQSYTWRDLVVATCLGMRVSFASTKRNNHWDLSVYTRVKVPGTGYAFRAGGLLRMYSMCGWSFSILRGNAGFSRLVADDSAFMVACLGGRLFEVKELCEKGEGRPDDISTSNMTPLLYAAQGGNHEVIRFLIDNGANVNWAGGSKQTAPLSWAIQHANLDVARILVKHGADTYHVNTLGWNPLFYCWPKVQATWEERSDFVKLLHEYSNLELDAVDTKHWTALHRASAFGTAQDVETLMGLGADPLKAILPLHWQAIFYAVQAGNWPTYSKLLPHYGLDVVRMADVRGWSLLHIAADIGSRLHIRDLLKRGANPNRESDPFVSYVEDNLRGRSLTPEDVARANSPEVHQIFLDVLSELAMQLVPPTSTDEDDDDDDTDDFHDATE